MKPGHLNSRRWFPAQAPGGRHTGQIDTLPSGLRQRRVPCLPVSGRFEIENDEARTTYLPGGRYSEAPRSPKATGWFRSTICSKQAAPRQLVTPARKAKGRRGGKHTYRTHPNHTALTRNTSFLSRQLAEQASFGFSATRTVCIKPLHVRKTTSITAHYFTRDSKPKLYVATSQASFFRRLLILR